MSAVKTVLRVELNAVRLLRASPDIRVQLAALDRERVLLDEIAALQGIDLTAANFARRDADPASPAPLSGPPDANPKQPGVPS
jgi:hypothetical protein